MQKKSIRSTTPALLIASLATILVGRALTQAHAQTPPDFDHMKCYAIKDPQKPKQFTATLAPKLTHDFVTEPGDTIVGGFTIKGCRIRVPAKFFCIDVDKQNAKEVLPPYKPAQWTTPGPESGERLCYVLSCPNVQAKSLPIIDQFGTRTIEIKNKTMYLCTPVTRQADTTDPCGLQGNGQCAGVCPTGETCLALSPSDCGCVPDSEACASTPAGSCAQGHCGGVWETCVTLQTGLCGCSHP